MALVGDPDDRLDLLDRPGLHHRGSLVVVPALEPERIPELGLALLGRQDVLGADDCCKVRESLREVLLGDVRWQQQGHGHLHFRQGLGCLSIGHPPRCSQASAEDTHAPAR